MRDQECVAFLQWILPQFNYQWKGFRKVRRQVCKRLQRRLNELELESLGQYREYLARNKPEWEMLDRLFYITISRFYRDPKIFKDIEAVIFPGLVQKTADENRDQINIWSIGSCSGEEPYSLNLMWCLSLPVAAKNRLKLSIIATDSNPDMLERAAKAKYTAGSLRFLPKNYLNLAFITEGNEFQLKEEFQKNISFIQQDIRKEMPPGDYDLILCRNLVFTYYRENLQSELLQRITGKLTNRGYLIIGSHEKLPFITAELQPIPDYATIFQKVSSHD